MICIQNEITDRCIELLRLPPDRTCLILDVGCGSGLSGNVLERHGHIWVGCDVSKDMLYVANRRIEIKKSLRQSKSDSIGGRVGEFDSVEINSEEKIETENNYINHLENTGDLLYHDMGTGLPFRAATFDACISVSALQWLCYSNSKEEIPKRRLVRFFSSLYQVVKRGGRAALQFYPQTSDQANLIAECATRVGFSGGVVIDYPNSTKAKKHYLVLSFERVSVTPSSLVAKDPGIRVDTQKLMQKKIRIKKEKGGSKSRKWIIDKKKVQRLKGRKVRPDTKYTGRKRPTKF